MRINKSYQRLFPNNCAIIEIDGDGKPVGVCTFYLIKGRCPRHGNPANKPLAPELESGAAADAAGAKET